MILIVRLVRVLTNGVVLVNKSSFGIYMGFLI